MSFYIFPEILIAKNTGWPFLYSILQVCFEGPSIEAFKGMVHLKNYMA